MAGQQLKALFCERFGCPPAGYDERAFRRCLYRHARFLAPVIRRLSPRFFADDFALIRDLGATTDWQEAHTEVLTFQDTNRAKRSLWRTGLRIRVSGRKAADLANRLFSAQR
jgi:hypothetical protein